MDLSAQLHQILNDTFGLKNFRAGQLESITKLLECDRLLCIQPTGYGKSLLYQVPAVYLDGITLVISPLLALMRDQILQLRNRFNISAATINTDQGETENNTVRLAAKNNKIKVLFIAPEQLDNLEKFTFLLNLPIKLLVVDEAHCISTWGHDFRPSYRQIVRFARELTLKNPQLKLLALTATANALTEKDIKQQLMIDKRKIYVHRESMDRSNIRLSVISTNGITEKLFALTQLLPKLEGVGLIYCATREKTEIVAGFLQSRKIATAAYHAGLDTQTKLLLQNAFLNNKYRVMTATNALGMGIDKSDLRYIIHFDYPGSMTAYYQEVGRSGRDRLPAEGILFYDPADTRIQNFFIQNAVPSLRDFRVVLENFMEKQMLNLVELKRLTNLQPGKLNVILAELMEQKFISKDFQFGYQIYVYTNKPKQPDLSRYQDQLEIKKKELLAMQVYAESSKRCLMKMLRVGLGDKRANNCNQCSNCAGPIYEIECDLAEISSISVWQQRRVVA